MKCGVCGGGSFSFRKVLWKELINDWQLSAAEAAYVNRQQGEKCNSCGSNLRSIALGNAIRSALHTEAPLIHAAELEQAKDISILEINEAGTLTPVLQRFGKYVFGAYPEVDIHAMPYADESFDIVVHSDTLEHVQNPAHALGECRRVLKPGGALCFTVPVIVGRLTRSRQGLKHSYHGASSTASPDFAVQSEFGADAWTFLMEAGFDNVQIFTVEYPVATAFLARKDLTRGQ